MNLKIVRLNLRSGWLSLRIVRLNLRSVWLNLRNVWFNLRIAADCYVCERQDCLVESGHLLPVIRGLLDLKFED